MNKELLLIDLLAEKKLIFTYYYTFIKRRIIALLIAILTTSLLFLGLGQLTYLYLLDQTQNPFYEIRITNLYHFSTNLGYFFLFIFSLGIILCLIKYSTFKKHFHEWLKNKVETLSTLEILEEDANYYYFINNQDVNDTPTKRALLKKSIKVIPLSENETNIMLGYSRSIFYLNQIYFLMEPTRVVNQLTTPKTKSNSQKKIIQIAMILGLFASFMSYFYLTGKLNPKLQLESQLTTDSLENVIDIQDGDTLIPKNEVTHDQPSELEMTYFYDKEHDLYFQTTNYGKDWMEVPVSVSDTRRGIYGLSSGQIPIGYFMDYTYDISPDFSWYLYSPEPKEEDWLDLNFLRSTDNGQTWTSHLISKVFEQVRYRKVQILKNGFIMVYTSTPTGMSPENFSMYYSTDNGVTWYQGAESTVNAPIQNVSFISQTTGFLATRDSLFYTNNGGVSFDEAIIELPEGYKKEGVDIFTSPKEVTQKSANTLSIQLNLVKTEKIDIHKIFECEFSSTDNGATWHFEKQLKSISNKTS